MVFVEYKLFILFQCFHGIASWTKLTFKLFKRLKLLIFKRREIPQNAFDLLTKKSRKKCLGTPENTDTGWASTLHPERVVEQYYCIHLEKHFKLPDVQGFITIIQFSIA